MATRKQDVAEAAAALLDRVESRRLAAHAVELAACLGDPAAARTLAHLGGIEPHAPATVAELTKRLDALRLAVDGSELPLEDRPRLIVELPLAAAVLLVLPLWEAESPKGTLREWLLRALGHRADGRPLLTRDEGETLFLSGPYGHQKQVRTKAAKEVARLAHEVIFALGAYDSAQYELDDHRARARDVLGGVARLLGDEARVLALLRAALIPWSLGDDPDRRKLIE